MIITRISGGLGNQMFQYAIAKSLAKKNNDIFKVDLSFYPKQTLRKYELNLFNIEEIIATEKECIELRGNEGSLFKVLKKLKLSIKRPTSYTKEKQYTIFDKEVYKLQGEIYLDGFWQNEKYFTSIREELIQDFSLKHEISVEAQKHLKDIKNTNSVSLHIRRGDYVSDAHTNNVHGVCDIEYYKNAINYINEHVTDPMFYIFSDDIFWCKKNFYFLKEKVFIDDTKSAIDDLELMKQCKHNIIANSSFSWWGAWLNKNEKKIIIAPKIWFSFNPDMNLALEGWTKI